MSVKTVFICIKDLIITFVISIFVLMNIGAIILVVWGIIEFSGEEWNTPQYHCADDGGIWDDEKEICRHDCEAWNRQETCVPLLKNNEGASL